MYPHVWADPPRKGKIPHVFRPAFHLPRCLSIWMYVVEEYPGRGTCCVRRLLLPLSIYLFVKVDKSRLQALKPRVEPMEFLVSGRGGTSSRMFLFVDEGSTVQGLYHCHELWLCGSRISRQVTLSCGLSVSMRCVCVCSSLDLSRGPGDLSNGVRGLSESGRWREVFGPDAGESARGRRSAACASTVSRRVGDLGRLARRLKWRGKTEDGLCQTSLSQVRRRHTPTGPRAILVFFTSPYLQSTSSCSSSSSSPPFHLPGL